MMKDFNVEENFRITEEVYRKQMIQFHKEIRDRLGEPYLNEERKTKILKMANEIQKEL